MTRQTRRGRRSGVTLLTGVFALTFIIPMVGLVIDVGVLYSVKARLQSAVDGAALAAARALNAGQTTEAQTASAKQNAVNWFYANFPLGSWGTSSTVMGSSDVQVFDDPNNPRVRNVTVAASTYAATYFMRWFAKSSTLLRASGNASRRDVVIMMVLDRSGSMQSAGACGAMKAAAKLFTGQFAAGRDRIGLISYSTGVYIHSAPTTNFQAVLGYQNGQGSGSGAIDTIQCNGWTSTAQSISAAYNEIYKVNLPGALNVIMLETDGLPNTLTMNFWDSATSAAGIKSTSPCWDANNKTKAQGGFATAASLRQWTTGWALGAGSYSSDIPAGIVGGVAADDPASGTQMYLMYPYQAADGFTTVNYLSSTRTRNCSMNNNHQPFPPPADLAWFPATDVWGNSLDPAYGYLPVSHTGNYVVSNNYTSYHNAALNATDHAAYRARTNSTIPAHFFAIGLGGTSSSPPDYVLLQRLANDPNPDNYNTPARYPACASSPNCATYSDQPQGTFIFSASAGSLSQAFLKISSEVLRLSK
jgi:Flp pilus assembly protein TadG